MSGRGQTLKQRLLFQLLRHGLRIQHFGARQAHRMEQVLSGLAMAALPADQRTRLTAALYGSRGIYGLEDMFTWEETWFQEDLPVPPARILVGGAGSGREIRHLADKGYEIVAFDPASSFVRNANKTLSSEQCKAFLVGSYEDLADPAASAARSFNRKVEELGPYDAVLLGWGSFTHVDTRENRAGLMRRFLEICPDGPVLLSFWMRGDDSQVRKSRAWELGWRFGKKLRTASHTQPDPGDWFVGNAGFGHFFTLDELERLAADTGYEIKRAPKGAYAGTYPHATLVPAPGRG